MLRCFEETNLFHKNKMTDGCFFNQISEILCRIRATLNVSYVVSYFKDKHNLFERTFFFTTTLSRLKSILIHDCQHKSTRLCAGQHESDTS